MLQAVQVTDAENVAVENDRRIGLNGPYAIRHDVRRIRRPPIGVAADVSETVDAA